MENIELYKPSKPVRCVFSNNYTQDYCIIVKPIYDLRKRSSENYSAYISIESINKFKELVDKIINKRSIKFNRKKKIKGTIFICDYSVGFKNKSKKCSVCKEKLKNDNNQLLLSSREYSVLPDIETRNKSPMIHKRCLEELVKTMDSIVENNKEDIILDEITG